MRKSGARFSPRSDAKTKIQSMLRDGHSRIRMFYQLTCVGCGAAGTAVAASGWIPKRSSASFPEGINRSMDGEAYLSEPLGHERLLEGDVLQRLATLGAGSCSLAVSSPPYNIRKSYERNDNRTYDEYVEWQRSVVKAMAPALTAEASVCWQVGSYVADGEVFPLDVPFISIFRELGFRLRNRIIWRYNFGYNADKRFSGRYETVLWFSRSDTYTFNLDPVRVRQLYPGKRHKMAKGAKGGTPSGNPLGKNPSDYWEFSADEDFKNNPICQITHNPRISCGLYHHHHINHYGLPPRPVHPVSNPRPLLLKTRQW